MADSIESIAAEIRIKISGLKETQNSIVAMNSKIMSEMNSQGNKIGKTFGSNISKSVKATLKGMNFNDVVKAAEGLASVFGKEGEAAAKGIIKPISAAVPIVRVAMAGMAGAVGAFASVADAVMEISRKKADEAIEDIDRLLEETSARIEEERQAALEAADFIDAQNSESIQAKIDAAIESGDEVLQYELERRQQEMMINEEYDAKQKAAEQKAAREKAQIEYKVAQEEYALDITKGILNGAMAVSNALASGPPPYNIIAGVAAGIAAAAQLAVLIANPPKPPKFATGGIVPGNPMAGDTVGAMLTPGELVLNAGQQENVAAQLGAGGSTQIVVILQMDGREVAQTVANVVGSGQVLIPLRGIQ